jgi:hypothetical protein
MALAPTYEVYEMANSVTYFMELPSIHAKAQHATHANSSEFVGLEA